MAFQAWRWLVWPEKTMDGIPRIEAWVAAPTVPEKGTAMPELSVYVST